MEITVVGTIKIDGWRDRYFSYSLKSVMPIAGLLSWRLNIAGTNRESARDAVKKRWDDVLITTDDNETCTYDLLSTQLASLPDDALVYPWVEDMWFVCPRIDLFSCVLDKFIHSEAEVMPVSHLVAVWEEEHLRTAITSNRFYSEYLIDLPSQERVLECLPGAYWAVSISSIFKIRLLRDVVEHQREYLSSSHQPHGLELPPERARAFLVDRSFIRLVPHFHVFREVIASGGLPRRCISWGEATKMLELYDLRGHDADDNHDTEALERGNK